MSENPKNESELRQYLLGRISDENLLAEYEELLFTDEDFCSLAEIVEDDLINDYVLENLNDADRADFEKTFECSPDRRKKIALTGVLREYAKKEKTVEPEIKYTLFDSIKAFFKNPLTAGAFAVLIIVAIISVLLITNRKNGDEIAELKEIYKQARPVESRISEFDYAPLTATRGTAEEIAKNRLRRIENTLLESVEKNPTAENRHALGIFYLTKGSFDEAVDEFKKSVEAEPGNAGFQNDLGAAYLESASTDKTRKLENLARANESFTAALKIDPGFSAARFNKSLTLQKLDLPKQARESWEIYLQNDASSKWADEARKNLEKLDSTQNLFKPKEQILQDFLSSYHGTNKNFALKIHNETKGKLAGESLFLLLTRRYLEARRTRNETDATESLEALRFIGSYEKEKHADFFISEIIEFYSRLDDEKIERVIEAKNNFDAAFSLMSEFKYAEAINEFEKSRDAFRLLGNEPEAVIGELWAVQFLTDMGKIVEAERRLTELEKNAVNYQYKIILPPVFYWQYIADFRRNLYSDSLKNAQKALRLAREGENYIEIEHSAESVIGVYTELGEIEKSLNLWSELIRSDAYFQIKSQYWRNKSNLVDLMIKLDLNATANDVSNEELLLAGELYPKADLVNSSLRRRAAILDNEKRFDEALKTVEESKNLSESRPASEQNDFSLAEDFLLRADLLRNSANCEKALGDYEKSLELYRRIPEFSVSIYAVQKGKLLCYNTLGRQKEFQTELEKILKISEEYRRKISEDESRQAFFGNEQIVFDTAIENAIAEGKPDKAFKYAETSRSRSLLELLTAEKQVGEIAVPLNVEEVQERLPADAQIVQYAVLQRETLVWLVAKDRFELEVKEIEMDELGKKIVDFRHSILEKKTRAEIAAAAAELYQLLIPISAEKNKKLVLIPDKNLNLLPFAALIAPDGKFLVEEFSILYSASSTVLLTASEKANSLNKKDSEKLLSIGNPAFDRSENPSLNDLPDAETEVRTISAFYPQTSETTGENAVREFFLKNLEAAEIIHFAGHFLINPTSPNNSSLLFADGDLRISELKDKRLTKAKLVVLSACETALERFNKSEGAIGAARVFLAIGAPQVVAGNWKIDSSASKDLMISFHEKRRRESLSSAESLRRAQIEMLRGENYEQPYYWAAFSIYGGFAEY